MVNDVNWEKAYKELEKQIEFIIEEVDQLIQNKRPVLKINKIRVDRTNNYTGVIVDASGSQMMYACYLYNKKNKELKRIMYQYSNTFLFMMPKGEYMVRVFVRDISNKNETVSSTLKFYS